jgi:hypothetical protein
MNMTSIKINPNSDSRIHVIMILDRVMMQLSFSEEGLGDYRIDVGIKEV